MIDQTRPLSRRHALGAGLAGVVLVGCGRSGGTPPPVPPTEGGFAGLESRFGGRIGAVAVDVGSGRTVGHRAGERFLMLSTVKVPLVAAVLRRSVTDPGLLDRTLHWEPGEVLDHAPATRPATGTGLTVVFPPGRAPIVLAVCVVPNDPRSTSGKPAVAAAAGELLRRLLSG